MIKMHGYIPAWGVPDVSPFVTKIDCYLRMVGLPYELVKLEQGDLTKTPKGKLPVIEDERMHAAEDVVEGVVRDAVERGVHQGTDSCLYIVVNVSRMGGSLLDHVRSSSPAGAS